MTFFYFSKTATKNGNFKELLFPPGGLQENESWHIFTDLCRFSKKCCFATFLKILPKLY